MRVLFVCNWNQNRSKTAEEFFAAEFETRSAGLYGGERLRTDHLEWAEVVVVMDDAMHREIAARFPVHARTKRIVDFDVPNVYGYDDDDLKQLLRRRADKLLKG